MKEKVYVLIGEKETSNIDLIASWYHIPSRLSIDTLTTELKSKYKRFAIMEDILFIEGEKETNIDDDF